MLYARFVDTAGRLGDFAKARRKRCCGGRRCGRSAFRRFGGGWVFAVRCSVTRFTCLCLAFAAPFFEPHGKKEMVISWLIAPSNFVWNCMKIVQTQLTAVPQQLVADGWNQFWQRPGFQEDDPHWDNIHDKLHALEVVHRVTINHFNMANGKPCCNTFLPRVLGVLVGSALEKSSSCHIPLLLCCLNSFTLLNNMAFGLNDGLRHELWC